MGEGRRRALLIAVPQYPGLGLPDLGVTAEDTTRLRKALLESGYDAQDVTVLTSPQETTGPRIRQELNTFLASCTADDFALVYFSGHGLHFGGEDYLVPSDARTTVRGTEAAPPNPRDLIAVVPDELLEHLSTDTTVMICLDACRDTRGLPLPLPRSHTVSRQRDGVWLVQACVTGQRAHATETSGSFMGLALAEAFSPDHHPRTVAEVIAYVRARTPDLAPSTVVPPHVEASWLGGDNRAKEERQRLRICEAGPNVGRWAQEVRTSAVWERVEGGNADGDELTRRLETLVAAVLKIRRSNRTLVA